MKILVGYANSPEGKAALNAAIAEAEVKNAELIVARHVRVTADAQQTGPETKAARDELAQLEDELKSQGIACRSEWSLGMQAPSTALVALAQKEAADLVVIGVRRRSPVGKVVLGSNAQDIILNADCPVLAVKAHT